MKKLTRRDLLRTLSLSALSALISGRCGDEKAFEFTLHCLNPEKGHQKILHAFCDAVIPGRNSDPEGSPGAVDVCSLNLLYDDSFMFKKIAPLIAEMIDRKATRIYRTSFWNLSLEKREKVIKEVLEEFPLLILVIKLVKSAFYAGGFSTEGLEYMGYPGSNSGYFNDPQFSFRKPVSREKTKDGNMP